MKRWLFDLYVNEPDNPRAVVMEVDFDHEWIENIRKAQRFLTAAMEGVNIGYPLSSFEMVADVDEDLGPNSIAQLELVVTKDVVFLDGLSDDGFMVGRRVDTPVEQLEAFLESDQGLLVSDVKDEPKATEVIQSRFEELQAQLNEELLGEAAPAADRLGGAMGGGSL